LRAIEEGSVTITVFVPEAEVTYIVTVNVYPADYDISSGTKLDYDAHSGKLKILSPDIIKKCTVICAKYNKQNILTEVYTIKDISVPAGGKSVDVKNYVSGSYYRMKFMLWDSIIYMKPLCNEIII